LAHFPPPLSQRVSLVSTFLKACSTPLISALISTCLVPLPVRATHAARLSYGGGVLSENVNFPKLAAAAIGLTCLIALQQPPRLYLGPTSDVALFQF